MNGAIKNLFFPVVQGAGVEDEWVNNRDLSGDRVDREVTDT